MRRVHILTGGHPFEADPFFATFDVLAADGVCEWRHVGHPDVLGVLRPALADDTDVVVLYDMPGLRFRIGQDPPAELVAPPPGWIRDLYALLDRGIGVVALHHSLASWPAWEGWADLVGGRFHYLPARLRDGDWPASGYVEDAPQHFTVVAPDHPVCAGVEDFDLVCEGYLCPIFEDEVKALVRTGLDVTDPSGFSSAELAIRGRFGENEGWTHPAGSSLAAWVKVARRSPLVYLQLGDNARTYEHPAFRRLLANAIDWTASDEARTWARG